MLSCIFVLIRGLLGFRGLNLSMMTQQNFDRFDIVKRSSLVKSIVIFSAIEPLLYLLLRYVVLSLAKAGQIKM